MRTIEQSQCGEPHGSPLRSGRRRADVHRTSCAPRASLGGRHGRLLCAIIISAVIIAALFVFLWLRGAFLPRDLEWNREAVRQVPEEVRNILPAGSLVQDALHADITGDGEEEWILLVWKRGSFGKHRPTWVERDSWDFSQHVFLYTTESAANTAVGRNPQSSSGVTDPAGGSVNEDKGWRPLWMSSALGKRVRFMRCGEEIMGDCRKTIVLTDTGGKETRWGWISFGLMLLDEGQ